VTITFGKSTFFSYKVQIYYFNMPIKELALFPIDTILIKMKSLMSPFKLCSIALWYY